MDPPNPHKGRWILMKPASEEVKFWGHSTYYDVDLGTQRTVHAHPPNESDTSPPKVDWSTLFGSETTTDVSARTESDTMPRAFRYMERCPHDYERVVREEAERLDRARTLKLFNEAALPLTKSKGKR